MSPAEQSWMRPKTHWLHFAALLHVFMTVATFQCVLPLLVGIPIMDLTISSI
jgi:hypothetical protein